MLNRAVLGTGSRYFSFYSAAIAAACSRAKPEISRRKGCKVHE